MKNIIKFHKAICPFILIVFVFNTVHAGINIVKSNGITLTGADGITLTGADGITLTGADGFLDIFVGGGADVAARLGVPVLAQIPLSVALREGGDAGLPVVLRDPQDAASTALLALAESLATRPRGPGGKPLGLSVS